MGLIPSEGKRAREILTIIIRSVISVLENKWEKKILGLLPSPGKERKCDHKKGNCRHSVEEHEIKKDHVFDTQ
jgi:hypothetical protein